MMHKINNPQVEFLMMKIRDPNTQKAQFRQCLQRVGQIIAYKINQSLEVRLQKITTIMNKEATHLVLTENPVLITVLRAGLPLHSGIQKVFSESESGFIGAMRNQQTLQANVSYVALPEIQGRSVIIADTMLATGGSMIQAIKQVQKKKAKNIIIAVVIAANQGIQAVNKFDGTIPIYCAAIDPQLNQKGYIVPGLGDAGDRSYGRKIQ